MAVSEDSLEKSKNKYPKIPAIEVTIPHLDSSWNSTFFKSIHCTNKKFTVSVPFVYNFLLIINSQKPNHNLISKKEEYTATKHFFPINRCVDKSTYN